MRPIPRRRFLSLGAGAAAAGVAAACVPQKPPAPQPKPTTPPPPPPTPAPAAQRSLVVLEMNGGNDGWSTLVPRSHSGYYAARPTTAIAASEALPVDAEWGLHPNLGRLHQRGVAHVAGVGAQQNPERSHFEMLRRWWAGDLSGHAGPETGFLGRLCDELDVGGTPAVGVTIGWGPTPALDSQRGTTIALDPDADGNFPGPDWDDNMYAVWLDTQRAMAEPDSGEASEVLCAARAGMDSAVRFGDLLVDLPGPAEGYPQTSLGERLRMAARLVAADIGTRVVHVPFNGDFDTHERHSSRHDALMAHLDECLERFLADLDQRAVANQVLVATTSEFGRRIAENGSIGLDHGTASAMMLAGPVHPGVFGEFPDITGLGEWEDPDSTVDIGEYYATLASWFGVGANDVLPGSPTPLTGVLV